MGTLESATSNILYTKGQRFDQAAIKNLNSTNGSLDYLFPAAQPNPLRRFASFVPLFMMGVINKSDVGSANPIGSSINYMVFGSAGNVGQKDPNGIGKRVRTAYGTPEYFINNFEVITVAASTEATANQSTTQIKFDIFEPYSLGLFLQSLQIAAIKAGYENYLEAVFMLRLDFVGWDENGNSSIEPTSQRFFPIRFNSAQIKATEAGSTYNCVAFPVHAIARMDSNNELKTSVTVSGRDVKGMTEALQTTLNEEQKKRNDGAKPDEYVIKFLDSTGSDSNKIPNSKIKNKNVSTDNTPTYTNGTQQNTPEDTSIATLSFGQNNSNPITITSILTEIMLQSDYCKEAFKNVDSTGFVNWFRIITDVKYKGETDPARAESPKEFTYYIVEYKAHVDVIKPPTAAESDTNALCKSVVKKFEYLYTGKNEEVLKWELDFNMTFFKAALTKAPSNTNANENARRSADEEQAYIALASGGNTDQWKRITGVARVVRSSDDIVLPNTGAAGDDQAVLVARLFEQAMRKTNDTAQLYINLEIMGDPYFLAQAGGYTKSSFPTSTGSMIASDGSMPSDFTNIMFFIGFKMPTDAPDEGSLFTFPQGYNPFSGLYILVKSQTFIKDGVFTQKLQARRLLDQVPLGVTAITSNPELLYKDQGKTAPPANQVESSSPTVSTPVAPQSTGIFSTPLPPPTN